MQFLLKLLAGGGKNLSIPVLGLLAGWYAGAKYGAPEFVMNTVDNLIEQGGEMVGGLMPGGDEEDAPADDSSS